MAGYVATNIIDGLVETVTVDKIDDLVAQGAFLIDVRTPEEYELGSIEGSVNIPLDELRDRLDEIPKDKDLYVTCQVGLRGYLAARILTQKGFKPINLDGGVSSYDQLKLNVNKESNSDNLGGLGIACTETQML